MLGFLFGFNARLGRLHPRHDCGRRSDDRDLLRYRRPCASMRIRDIGWDPVCVNPGWIAVAIIDGLVASKMPAIALGHQQPGTIVGALVNLALFLALLFWPSAEHDNSAPSSGEPFRTPDLPSRSPAAAASRVEVANGEFGRRAV